MPGRAAQHLPLRLTFILPSDDAGLMDLETFLALLATWIVQAALAYYTWTLKKVTRIGSDRQLALDIRRQVGTDDKLFEEYWARMERDRKAGNRWAWPNMVAAEDRYDQGPFCSDYDVEALVPR